MFSWSYLKKSGLCNFVYPNNYSTFEVYENLTCPKPISLSLSLLYRGSRGVPGSFLHQQFVGKNIQFYGLVMQKCVFWCSRLGVCLNFIEFWLNESLLAICVTTSMHQGCYEILLQFSAAAIAWLLMVVFHVIVACVLRCDKSREVSHFYGVLFCSPSKKVMNTTQFV